LRLNGYSGGFPAAFAASKFAIVSRTPRLLQHPWEKMGHAPQQSRLALAFLTAFGAILACTVWLRAQTTPTAQNEPGSEVNTADPRLITRADALIERARKMLDSFFEQTANVVCTEDVAQMMIDGNNKPMYREESIYEYQLQSRGRSGAPRFSETRQARNTPSHDPNKRLLITSGFASMLLVLHHNYESSFQFEPVGEEVIEERTLMKVHFEAVPGASSPAAMELRGRNYPLQLKGDIWLDEESGAVVKLNSSLEGGFDDLGLRDLRSEIRYSAVRFQNPEEAYRMPALAVIDVETATQHLRNVHRFSDYRRFRASMEIDFGDQKP
jgi:hypothetical protein